MIARMEKITLVGLMAERDTVLARLQVVGLAHVILPPEAVEQPEASRMLQKVVETQKFLSKLEPQAGQSASETNWADICRQREELVQSENRILGEITALKKERTQMAVWGEFDWADIRRLREAGLYIGFYRAPAKTLKTMDLSEVYHFVVRRSEGDTAFVAVAPTSPDLNWPEENLPDRSLSRIDEEIAQRMATLDNIRKTFGDLTVHLDRLKRAEALLTDHLEYQRVKDGSDSFLDNRLFVIKCWSPIPGAQLIEKLGDDITIHQYEESPAPDDRVPVLLENKAAFEPGEDLVGIYSTPHHKDFDPSGLVLYWFALFFGMIVGDAGYGLILLGLTLLIKKKAARPSPLVQRLIRMMFLLSGSVIIFGLISASYFNIPLGPDNILTKIRLFDFSSPEGQNFVMLVSIWIGMAHITLSVAIHGYRQKDYSQYGWVIVIWAGYALVSSKMGQGRDNPVAMWITIAGLGVVFAFSSKSKNVVLRLAGGFKGLLGIIQIFSDVLSYLRLFALSVATVYMSQTFNMLAGDINHSIPWIGWLFALLVLVLGHFINLVLAIMGGVIHGLRLNFLEWYRWCFEGDGLPYRPFARIGPPIPQKPYSDNEN